MSGGAQGARRVALASWLALVASVALWAHPAADMGVAAALIAGLPLLLPLPGLARGARRALGAAPLALAPALAIAITECLVNPAARFAAGVTLALALAAFAAILAALRSQPRG
jgi:uncharacterized membrane protein